MCLPTCGDFSSLFTFIFGFSLLPFHTDPLPLQTLSHGNPPPFLSLHSRHSEIKNESVGSGPLICLSASPPVLPPTVTSAFVFLDLDLFLFLTSILTLECTFLLLPLVAVCFTTSGWAVSRDRLLPAYFWQRSLSQLTPSPYPLSPVFFTFFSEIRAWRGGAVFFSLVFRRALYVKGASSFGLSPVLVTGLSVNRPRPLHFFALAPSSPSLHPGTLNTPCLPVPDIPGRREEPRPTRHFAESSPFRNSIPFSCTATCGRTSGFS